MIKLANPKLNFKLPPLSENVLYQIINIGEIKREGNNANSWFVKVYLLKRNTKTKKFIEDKVHQIWISIYQAPLLKIGTLWNEKGEIIKLSEFIYPNRKSFVLSDSAKETTLGQEFRFFPEIFNLVPKNFMESARSIPYIKIETRDKEYILIPCFEILRSLVYRGPSTLKYLFSNSFTGLSIKDICTILDWPSNLNDNTCDIVYNSRYYKQNDIMTFAELALSIPLDLSLRNAHNQIIVELDKQKSRNESCEAFLKVNPSLFEKKINLMACGIDVYVKFREENYFIVCSINNFSNFFSYNKLSYSFNIDTRSAESDKNSKVNHPRITSTGFYIKPTFDKSKTLKLDSSEGAYSRMLNQEMNLNIGDKFDLPSLFKEPKLLQKEKYKSRKIVFPLSPDALSNTMGGRNQGIAHADLNYNNKSLLILSIEQVFKEVAEVFNRAFPRKTNHLKLNINKNEYSEFSFFPCWLDEEDPFFYIGENKKEVGIIEIFTNERYYYYVVIIGSHKRAGFIYKSNYQKFSNTELNILILKEIARVEGNWTNLKNYYLKPLIIEKLKRKYNFSIIVLPRVQETALSVLELCIKDIKMS